MELKEPGARYQIEAPMHETEVGPLPNDWQVIRLSDRAEIQSGIAKNANASLRDPIAVPYLRVANVQDGYLDLTEVSTIDIERGDLNRYAVLPGDVLMNEGGDLDKLGRGAIWNGQIAPCVHQNHVFVVRCKGDLVPEYLNAWTSSAQARRYFMLAGRQTTNLASINKTSLGDLTIAVPPTEMEQQHIATALTDADVLIESLQQQLTKKRQIKQGAMQELLTGKRRLPGFRGDWRQSKYGELALIDPENLCNRTDSGFSFNYIALEDVDQGRLASFVEMRYENAPSRARRVLRTGDVLVSTVRPNLKSHLLFARGQGNWIASTGFSVVRCKTGVAHPGFLFALLFSAIVEQQIEALLTGSNYPAINGRDVSNLSFASPPFEEQRAIAQILSDMDTDIAATESRLTKARALNQAMAQALLTGRIRLKESNA
jgi:type I restriction enzyme S subunit